MDRHGDQPESTAIGIGSAIAGYRIDALVSRGGMGVVYRATNIALGQRYALKVIAPELADDQQFLERFRREIRLAASLRHPHAVEVHYAGEFAGQPFLVMDLIEGTNLRQVIATQGALDPARAVELLTQITGALDEAHYMGLIHRDIKPANVLIGERAGREHAYLTDFGLAKRIETRSDLTRGRFVVGTVDYMAPEQITGRHSDARTDVYALGCLFFHMLAGKVPFERENTAATMWAQVYDPRPPISAVRASVPQAFDAVLMKAMAAEPGERYTSAGDFARDAVAALSGSRYRGPATVVATGEARPPEIDDLWHAPPAVVSAAPAAAPAGVAQRANGTTEESPAPGAIGSEHAAALPPADGDPPPDPWQSARATGGPPPARHDGRTWRGRRKWALLLLPLAAIAAVLAVILASGSGGPTRPAVPTVTGDGFAAGLKPVPVNRVTGKGTARVVLSGDTAYVAVSYQGLVGAPHLMHFHAAGRGTCPDRSAAHDHGGNPAISALNGGPFYGKPVTALTVRGDTSVRKSLTAFKRYPLGSGYRYSRAIRVSPVVAQYIRNDNAVLVIHGIDYNGNGTYDQVLDRSDLKHTLTGESTAPALCGPIVPSGRGTSRRFSAELTPQPSVLALFCPLLRQDIL